MTIIHGYGDEDIITLKKPNGEIVEVVEVRTKDTVYLVKINKGLFNFEESIEKKFDQRNDIGVALPIGGNLSLKMEMDFDDEPENESLL